MSFQVLEILACDCGRKCSAGSCTCIDIGLKCTQAFKLKDCANIGDSSDFGDSDEDVDEKDDDNVYFN